MILILCPSSPRAVLAAVKRTCHCASQLLQELQRLNLTSSRVCRPSRLLGAPGTICAFVLILISSQGKDTFSCFCFLSSTSSFLSVHLYFYSSSQIMVHIPRRLNICHYFSSLSLSIPIGSSVSRKPDPEASAILTPNIPPVEQKQPTSCFYCSRPFPLPFIKPVGPMLSASHPKSIYTGTCVPFLARQEAIGQCPQMQPIAEELVGSSIQPRAPQLSFPARMHHLRACL